MRCHGDYDYETRFYGPVGALFQMDRVNVLPAVDDHGSSIGKLSLFSVHLSEEAQDATGLLGDSVIGPADVLVVPDGTAILRL